MSWFTGLWLAVLGILAAPNLIIAKKPEAKEIIAKMAPYQGWMGAVSAVWGLIKLIGTFKYFDWFSVIPVAKESSSPGTLLAGSCNGGRPQPAILPGFAKIVRRSKYQCPFHGVSFVRRAQ